MSIIVAIVIFIGCVLIMASAWLWVLTSGHEPEEK